MSIPALATRRPASSRWSPVVPVRLALVAILTAASAALSADAYHDDKALARALDEIVQRGERQVHLRDLAETPGGRTLHVLEILPAADKGGQDVKRAHAAPAVLVVADPLGTTPLATEAALRLARALAAGEDVPERAAALAWYVVTRANPDGAARFFAAPRRADGRNDRPRDDDNDGRTDEDPPDDLDGDGLLTSMLLPHPAGRWLLAEGEEGGPRLYREAEAAKGERGLYRLLVEGRDDDGDGEFNEDGPGGVVVGRNFPHAFEHWTDTAGSWPASEEESRALLAYAFDRPEIALVLVLGEANTLASVPESDRQAEVTGGTYRVPRRMAQNAGLDPDEEYELDFLVELARDMTGMTTLTAQDVLSFLGLGAAVNPDRNDLGWWNALAERYGEFLEEAGLDGPRLSPPPPVPGSVEEWAYYQFGVPSLALDFWSIPKPAAGTEGQAGAADLPTPDDVEGMSRDEFVALGEDTIAALLAAHAAPPQFTPQMVVQALQGGMLTPARIAEMMREAAAKEEAGGIDPDLAALARFSSERLGGAGFVDWTERTLPDGRTVLVGGPAPFVRRTPPAAMVDSLLAAQVPFLLEIPDWLPDLALETVTVEHRGGEVWELEAWVRNAGRIPYPTGQGKRCRRPPPVAATLAGADILEGRPRQTIAEVPAGGAASTRWLVRARPGARVTVEISCPATGTDRLTVTLEPKGDRR